MFHQPKISLFVVASLSLFLCQPTFSQSTSNSKSNAPLNGEYDVEGSKLIIRVKSGKVTGKITHKGELFVTLNGTFKNGLYSFP